MILWRNQASPEWLAANESRLEQIAGRDLAIIARPGRARGLAEVICRRVKAARLLRDFGRIAQSLSPNWWKIAQARQTHPPIRVGPRLEVVSAPARSPGSNGRLRLVIPAAGAFGTGEHSTTAMSLRLLQEIARNLPPGWRLLDAGTGTGILALAARRLGAGEVLGLDIDPRAVTHARQNARLSHIAAKFIAADVLRWKPFARYEVVTANLFSELLIAALPVFHHALRPDGRLIISGILREQAACDPHSSARTVPPRETTPSREMDRAPRVAEMLVEGSLAAATFRASERLRLPATRGLSVQPLRIPMQAEELSYIIVTPYSMRKSRTGGIVSRLISRTGLDLVGGRMFAPSEELVRRYAEGIVSAQDPRHRATQELIRDYVCKNFTGEWQGQRSRVLLLVFRGPAAIAKIPHVVGHIVHEQTSGETIRDTYGDYITDDAGQATYFEPGVLASFDAESVEDNLKLWAQFSDSDGGLLDDVISYPVDAKVEKSLVLIKPDNFKFPNSRPGGVIEVFSRTGLNIIGFKVHRMSVAQAEEFYGPVLAVLKDKLGASKGREAWEDIVEFMSGGRPSATSDAQRREPGTEKCIAIVYQGEVAVRKIRDVLGPTDPSKAPPGSIRKEFGQTIMINAAHASDSPENAKREMEIVQVRENNLKPLIENFYARP